MDTAAAAPIDFLPGHAKFFDLTTRAGRRRSHDHLRALFIGLQKTLRPTACFEIGANDAKFSRELRARWPAVAIHAFEANPYTYAKMLGEHPFASLGIDYRNLAVTALNGPVVFNVARQRQGQDLDPTLGDNSLMDRLRPGHAFERVQVEGATLERFAAEQGLTGPFGAWIDVEGAAEGVLTGMVGVMPDVASVLIEVEETALWDGQWLAADVSTFMQAHGMIPWARDFERPAQYNVIFLKAALVDDPSVSNLMTRHEAHLETVRASL